MRTDSSGAFRFERVPREVMKWAVSVPTSKRVGEIRDARERYKLVGHGDSFLDELDAVFEVIQAMPLRFPVVYGTIHRALLRRYPFAAFFRIRPETEHVVVLAVFPQRGDPAAWPKR